MCLSVNKEINPAQSQVSSDTRTKSDTVDKNLGEDTPGVDVIPQNVNQKTVAPAPVRDWRRTLQVMPRMEDFLSTWPKSKSVSIHDPVSCFIQECSNSMSYLVFRSYLFSNMIPFIQDSFSKPHFQCSVNSFFGNHNRGFTI